VEALAAYVGRSQASAAHHRLAREVLQGGNTRSVLHTAPFPRQLSVGLASREVRRGDDLVTLTPTEYGILAVLVRHLCQVLSHEQILQAVWGEHYGESQYLWVHIGHLRRKLEPNSKRPCYILIERGVWLSPGEAGGGVSAYDLPVIVGGVHTGRAAHAARAAVHRRCRAPVVLVEQLFVIAAKALAVVRGAAPDPIAGQLRNK
jgi:hypothetical protein